MAVVYRKNTLWQKENDYIFLVSKYVCMFFDKFYKKCYYYIVLFINIHFMTNKQFIPAKDWKKMAIEEARHKYLQSVSDKRKKQINESLMNIMQAK